VLAFHETHRTTHDSKAKEVIASLSFPQDPNQCTGRLVKGLDRRQGVAAVERLRLAKDAFVTRFVYIETEYLAAEPTLHNYAGWPNGRPVAR
jgi:hypothetical protein